MVALEDALISLNGDCERLGSEGCLHLGDVVLLDEAVRRHADGGCAAGIVLAGGNLSVSRDIGVGLLSLSLVGLPVLEGLVLPATVAAVVGGGARNELLLREADEVSSSDLVCTLEGTSGRE